jgi:hypothetical protein
MLWFGYGLWRLHDFRFRIGGGIGKCCTHGITHGAVRLINALYFYVTVAANAASDLSRPWSCVVDRRPKATSIIKRRREL